MSEINWVINVWFIKPSSSFVVGNLVSKYTGHEDEILSSSLSVSTTETNLQIIGLFAVEVKTKLRKKHEASKVLMTA